MHGNKEESCLKISVRPICIATNFRKLNLLVNKQPWDGTYITFLKKIESYLNHQTQNHRSFQCPSIPPHLMVTEHNT